MTTFWQNPMTQDEALVLADAIAAPERSYMRDPFHYAAIILAVSTRGLTRERDALRADVARLTAERDAQFDCGQVADHNLGAAGLASLRALVAWHDAQRCAGPTRVLCDGEWRVVGSLTPLLDAARTAVAGPGDTTA